MKISAKPGRLGSGPQARPTIKTIADLAGCSIATVSKALADSPVVAQDTRQRVLAAAEKLGYVASRRGVMLRMGRTFQAAVVMTIKPSLDHEWEGVDYAQILSGISRALEGTPYELSVHMARSVEDGLRIIRQIVESRSADGVIFSGTLPDDPRIDYLLAHDFPFVAMGRSEHVEPYPYVDIDSDKAAYVGTSHLLERGHRRIALVNPSPELMYARQRVDGYRRALRDRRVGFDPVLVAGGRLTADFGKTSVLRLASTAPRPTAYLCANEATALGVISGLGELGLVVGRDASVIAADDINVSAYFSPPITTLFMPIEDMSRTLGEFLLRRIDGEAPENLRRLYEPTVVERQSDRLDWGDMTSTGGTKRGGKGSNVGKDVKVGGTIDR